MVELDPEVKSVKARAPATCANVAVGFDLLGFPVSTIVDEVTLTRTRGDQVNITHIDIDANEKLPTDPEKNVASAVVIKFCQDHKISSGFDISIKKGIPLGSGMGGSAASSVAALTALNGFLKTPCPLSQLAQYAIYGEKIATGHKHADNVVPCLYGGLTLVLSIEPVEVLKLPIMDIYCVLVHPALRLDTAKSRQILPEKMALNKYVQQSRYLAGFMAAVYENNIELLQSCLQDVLIEPHRAGLVKGFAKVKAAAINAGAMGASLSGSGPSVFAFAKSKTEAERVAKAMVQAFDKEGVKAQSWISQIDKQAALILEKT